MPAVRLDVLKRQVQLRNSRAPVVSIAKAGAGSPHTPAPNPNVPAIPLPAENVSNLAACVGALKASVESLTGQRGDPPDRAVTFKDLVNYGVLSGDAVRSRQGTLVVSGGETITLSGDISGSGVTAITTTLATVNSNVGTFQGITVNGKGLVTAAVNQNYAPLASPSFSGTPTTPTASPGDSTTQIASTAFVQTAVQNASAGLDAKASVQAATTANITLSGTQTIDGIAVVVGDRVLVKDQSTASGNGIYTVASGAWARATDMDSWIEVPAAYCFVERGTVNADTGWVCTSDPGGVIGTNNITWAQFSGGGSLVAGGGMTKTGNTLDVVGTAARIVVNPDSIDIDSAYVGQASITTLGTIGTGTWNATIITVARGGTGVGTLTGYVKGTGTTPLTASATIPNTDISGLGTMSTQNANAVAITGGTIDGVTLDGGVF